MVSRLRQPFLFVFFSFSPPPRTLIRHEDHHKDASTEGLPGILSSDNTTDPLFSPSDKIDAEGEDTVADVKKRIEEAHGHPVANQKLINSG